MLLKWVKSYLNGRKQLVTVNGKVSNTQEIDTRTPQGSRISPLLFIILVADMDLWIQNSSLSNIADDTQLLVISQNIESALEVTSKEANSIVSYFSCNNLVNNPNKAGLLYNSKGKQGEIAIENIGGEVVKSTNSEKNSWDCI